MAISRSIEVVALRSLETPKSRLAMFLLQLALRTRPRVLQGATVALAMSCGELANHLGMRPETLSRERSRLVAAGLLRIDGRTVWILDPYRLKAVARGEQPPGPRSANVRRRVGIEETALGAA
jgi:CRP/FNR family transcriptional regulator